MVEKKIIETDHKTKIESRRSLVRVIVTYAAAGFIFVGGLVVLVSGALPATPDTKISAIKDFYLIILPVATTVITYWFASRKPQEKTELKEGESEGQTPPPE